MSDALVAGTTVLSPSGQAFTVSDALSAEFEPGDRLIATDLEGLLRIPAKDHDTANTAVTACHKAFNDMGAVTNDQIIDFYHQFAAALANDEIWEQIQSVNKNDVASARRRGRSTTRLVVSDKMRQGMIDGLNGWASMPSQRDAVLETIDHEDFRVELVGAALGLVAFVFEGRPNVLADACGVLRGGNTVVMRIGSDALSTANTIMSAALIPSLVAAGLPQHAVTLVNSPTHASGWALFLDQRLGLAVARGSGPAVAQLGALAQSVGTPVSLHGTGGAWIMASATADPTHFEHVVTRSLDRKVPQTSLSQRLLQEFILLAKIVVRRIACMWWRVVKVWWIQLCSTRRCRSCGQRGPWMNHARHCCPVMTLALNGSGKSHPRSRSWWWTP